MKRGCGRGAYLAGVAFLVGVALCLVFLWGGNHREPVGSGEPSRGGGAPPGADAPARLQGSEEAPGPAAAPTAASPAEPEPEWACEAYGRVIHAPGASPSAAAEGVSVTFIVYGEGQVAELPVAEDGSFSGRVPLPASSARLRCIARDLGGTAVSPLAAREVKSGQRVGFVLLLSPGARVSARVVDETGVPVPGAGLMVMERPVQPKLGTPTWEVEAILPAAYVVRCDEGGRARLPVRPGRVQLRPLGPDGSWGEASTFKVGLGESKDAGDLQMPASSTHIHGKVLDKDTREPVEGAWVQVDGEPIRWRKDLQPAPSVHSDREGSFTIRNLAPAALPMDAAVGSPAHEAVGVEFDGSETEVVVELTPRPTLHIRVLLAGGEPLTLSDPLLEDASWAVRFKHAAPLPRISPGTGGSPLFWVRDALRRGKPEVGPGENPEEAVARPPTAGGYEVTLRLPGGIRTKAEVELARGEHKTVTLELPRARATRLRFHHGAVELGEVGTTARFDLTWLAADGTDLAPGGEVDYEPDGGSMDLRLWGPPDAGGLRVKPRNAALSPFRETVVVLDAGPGAVTDVQLPVRPDAVPLEFHLAYRGEPIPLGGAVVSLVPADLTAAGFANRTAKTDDTGRAVMRVPPGAYMAVSLKCFGTPRSVEVEAFGPEAPVILLPTEP